MPSPPKEHSLKRKRPEDGVEQDPKLKEFLDVMQPPSKIKSWANEETQFQQGQSAVDVPMADPIVPEGESDDEYQVIPKKGKSDVVDNKTTSKSTSTTAHAAQIPSIQDESVQENHVNERTAPPPATEAGPMTDDDWLRSHTSRVLDLEDGDGGVPLPKPRPSEANEDMSVEATPKSPDPEGAPNAEPKDPEVVTEGQSTEDQIRDTGRLYLRNLPYDVTEDDLRDHFSKIGSLEEVRTMVFIQLHAAL